MDIRKVEAQKRNPIQNAGDFEANLDTIDIFFLFFHRASINTAKVTSETGESTWGAFGTNQETLY